MRSLCINTIDGNTTRYDERYVIDFNSYANKESLQRLLEGQVLYIKLNTREVMFLTSNIISIELGESLLG